ncbi:uncharacterized protein [Nicotiana tomentosiformis]|uniref:uncharacterized protein n=1 Tax=Nicotiana tomentosiformis TaxID=4098 RepID=UPI00388C5CEE
MGWIGDVIIQHMPRNKNKKADALASLALSLTLYNQAQVTICQKWVVPLPNEGESEENELEHLVAISEVEKKEWRQPIIDYLSYGILPKNPRRRTEIRHHAPHFLYYKDTPYKRSFEGPPKVLHPTVASLPFDAWGLDVVGPLPKSSGGHLYILAATDYFSKWAEVMALKEKVVSESKRDWHDRMEEALWAYRTTHCTPTQATPYALVYGVEAVLPLERRIPSLQLAIQEGIIDKENAWLRLVEMEALDEKRLEA